MDALEFSLDQKIDPEGLDVDCVNLPNLYMKWAERAIEARGAVDRLKLQLETLQAGLEIAVRKTPRKYGLDKATDASAKATVLAQPEYLSLHEKYFQARDDSALLDKAVVAMEIKKRMIESLITLHGQQYFAGPSAPRDLKGAWLAQQDAAADRVKNKMLGAARTRNGNGAHEEKKRIKIGRRRGE